MARLLYFFLILMTGTAVAQTALPLDPALGIATIPLYDGPAPGGQDATDQPTLTIFTPQPGQSNGSAILVAPGGAYIGLASNLEGRQVADWFTTRGFTAFVLKYRLGKNNLFPIPLLDAQRAIRLIRSNARKYGLNPDRIGVIGFSAGGHLAALTGTLFHDVSPTPSDPIDGASDRPDFLVLGYPWINAMDASKHAGLTYCSLIKSLTADQCTELMKDYSPASRVTSRTPPAFIYGTSDDALVPARTVIEFYNAMLAAKAPVEMHLFQHGAHGSGLGTGDAALDLWPVLLEQWLRGQGLLTRVPASSAPGKSAMTK